MTKPLTMEQLIKRTEKERAKRIKRRNKKLSKHGMKFVRWVTHQDGTRSIVMKVVK